MARETCADCGGPRDPGSSYLSYCTDCGKARQRDRYKRIREEAGFQVKQRTANTEEVEVVRRKYLRENEGKPGNCELCDEFVEERRLLLFGPNQRAKEFGVGVPFLLVCELCEEAAALSGAIAKRVKLLQTHLMRTKQPWELVVSRWSQSNTL